MSRFLSENILLVGRPWPTPCYKFYYPLGVSMVDPHQNLSHPRFSGTTPLSAGKFFSLAGALFYVPRASRLPSSRYCMSESK